jgi:HAD superfamily hydrolase (TIGR01509 family)
MDLRDREFWVFDMDGTLTVPAHDFDAIRKDLELAEGIPILEQLKKMSREEAAPKLACLDAIEKGIADGARPQPGAEPLLRTLREGGARVGILTRNSRDNAWRTLSNCGLDAQFEPASVIGRDCCEPKPSGDGVRRLLRAWEASPTRAVMVGDFLFDLLAGRDAGTATVYLDSEGAGRWSAHADVTVTSLAELHGMIGGRV